MRYHPAMPTLRVGWLVWLVLCGCGGEPAAPPREANYEPMGVDDVNSTADEQAPPSRLEQDLAALCAVATEQLADRSRPSPQRWQVVGEWMRQEPAGQRIATWAEDVDTERHGRGYAGMVSAARSEGIGWSCEAFGRFEELLRSGDLDMDAAHIASFADDLDQMCRVVQEEAVRSASPEDRARVMARRIDEAITNPTLREVFAALANTAPDQRYPLLQAAARDEGIAHWSCPALRALLAPP
jgi:hypothetical protein